VCLTNMVISLDIVNTGMWHVIFITQHNTNQTDIIVFLILCLVRMDVSTVVCNNTSIILSCRRIFCFSVIPG
jgi:hypothetical protein